MSKKNKNFLIALSEHQHSLIKKRAEELVLQDNAVFGVAHVVVFVGELVQQFCEQSI